MVTPSENVSIIPPTGSGVNFTSINNNNLPSSDMTKDQNYLKMPIKDVAHH
jgi:hypothetical protein